MSDVPINEPTQEQIDIRDAAIAARGESEWEEQASDAAKDEANDASSDAVFMWIDANQHMNEQQKDHYHSLMHAGNFSRLSGDRMWMRGTEADDSADLEFNLADEKWRNWCWPTACTHYAKATPHYVNSKNEFKAARTRYNQAYDYYYQAYTYCEGFLPEETDET
jgi:hypothetical protein